MSLVILELICLEMFFLPKCLRYKHICKYFVVQIVSKESKNRTTACLVSRINIFMILPSDLLMTYVEFIYDSCIINLNTTGELWVNFISKY